MQEENQRVVNSAPSGYFGYINGSGYINDSTSQASPQETSPQESPTVVASSPQQQTSIQQPPPDYVQDPAWIQMQEENQRLIDSAPPGYWGAE